MKHVSFVLRLSYETCFVNREFIVFLDFCPARQFPVLAVLPGHMFFPNLAILEDKRYKIILST